MAQLLHRPPEVRFSHEPFASDRHLVPLAHAGGFDRYLDDQLKRRFAAVAAGAHSRQQVYGESNGYLRYFSRWLTNNLDARVVHIHRDGRSFLNSAYTRPVYTEHEAGTPAVPRDDDPAASQWAGWSRFQRLCWYWDFTNRFLLETTPARASMESITRDYDRFRESLLHPLRLDIPEPEWRAAVAKRANAQPSQLWRARWRRWLGRSSFVPPEPLPHWTRWPEQLTEQFWRICGGTMDALGYER